MQCTWLHDPIEMVEEEYGWRCPQCRSIMCKADEPKWEQATLDDPHSGELFRYPVDFLSREEMIMYRGGETWLRRHGQLWQMLTPWRPASPTLN